MKPGHCAVECACFNSHTLIHLVPYLLSGSILPCKTPCRITKSFRANPRITLALQGKTPSLDRRGVYEALEQLRKEQTQEEVESLLPKLEPDKRRKLQDDLVYGLHVTYHDKGGKSPHI